MKLFQSITLIAVATTLSAVVSASASTSEANFEGIKEYVSNLTASQHRELQSGLDSSIPIYDSSCNIIGEDRYV